MYNLLPFICVTGFAFSVRQNSHGGLFVANPAVNYLISFPHDHTCFIVGISWVVLCIGCKHNANTNSNKSRSNPIQYWYGKASSFPQLSQLACKYLTLPASSAPVERLFSVVGKIFRPDRCCLTDKRFQELMFLRCNYHITETNT